MIVDAAFSTQQALAVRDGKITAVGGGNFRGWVGIGADAGLSQTVSPKAESKSIPRTPGGKPDFTGFFNIQYTPNMAMGKEYSIPYTAVGKTAYIKHDAKDDPTSNCWLPGMPRIMQSHYPAQFVQTPSHL